LTLVGGASDVLWFFNRRACGMFHFPGDVVNIFRWASAQHGQASEQGR
jgi:hypothetical protein